MYLKRLELKGFKSFADKVSITLEPGISAIVGPNGSGKSNICDAILWVLGERNAKSLRGGVMEDVIFAGSSNRTAVSVAEVSLVLDNSDGVLPIEYNEVSVSRRLYRSGESEYLINGVNSRRLDVLDILHDSGIGTDTNSIISQGHLDSILQSKPSDRRTLIEEAAGVLKHKQRKIRSQKKLERMDANLERIGDIMAEIERQLKPLRIKAKRAAAYDGLVSELQEITTNLAVDDLKKIKRQWDECDKKQKESTNIVDEKRHILEQKEKELNDLRSVMANQNSDIVEYSTKQRNINSVIEKLSAQAMLLNQMAKSAQEKYKTLNEISSEGSVSSAKQTILDEIDQINNKLHSMENEVSELDGLCKTSELQALEAQKQFEKFQNEIESKNSELQKHQQELSAYRNMINEANEELVDFKSKSATLKSKIEEVKEKIEQNKNEIKDALNTKVEKQKLLEAEQKQFDKNQKKIQDSELKLNDNQHELDIVKNKLNDIKSDILATEKFLETNFEQSSGAYKWVSSNKNNYSTLKLLSDSLDVPDKYINLVESLLGGFSSSFIAENTDITSISNDIKNNDDVSGTLRMVSSSDNKYVNETYNNAKKVADSLKAIVLSDEVKLSNGKIFGMFSNVLLFENNNQCVSAFKKYSDICCVSLEGLIIYPDGRYVFSSTFNSGDKEGSDTKTEISSKKNLAKLKKAYSSNEKKVLSLEVSLEKSNKEIDDLREKENIFKNNLATYRAEFEFADKYLNELNQGAQNYKDILEKTQNEYEALAKEYKLNIPDVDKSKEEISRLTSVIEDIERWLSNNKSKLENFRNTSNSKKQESNNLAVKQAALNERFSSLKENLTFAQNRLKEQDSKEAKNSLELKNSQMVSRKCGNIANILNNLSNLAKNNLENLDSTFGDVSKLAAENQKKSDVAIKACNDARALFDEENSKLSKIQVEMGILETKVQHCVDVINQIDGVSVDSALEMPDVENRQDLEEKQFKLRRRIANMGVINPDAKNEYEVLKERYDFLNDQVSDLRAAKISLYKIDRIIDSRMKDDFINTFNEVNSNFSEIFEILFPGGRAKLELESPDDVDNSGVEVKAQPYGKSISKMSLLSGGEKSLVALCLLFAVYKKRSTPFYILDEVEAALDDTNLRRLIKYLDNLSASTQLIMITHQRRTMEMADVLYGVSMKNDGVTRVVSQKLDKDNKLHDIDK